MPRRHRLCSISHRPQFINQPLAVEGLNHRSSVIPRHPDTFFVMREVVEIQLKRIFFGENHLAKKIGKLRLTVRSQPHDFVLISVEGKA